MQEQFTVCLYGHFRGDLFSLISLSCENRNNKLLTKINWFTVYMYRNDPKFLDRLVWANRSGSSLFAISFASF